MDAGASQPAGRSIRSIREAAERGDVTYLIESLAEPDPMHRGVAARWLGLSGDRAGVEPLLRLLRRDPKLRVLAIVQLERLRDPSAIPTLHEFAEDEESPLIVRVNAMAALGTLGDDRAVKLLIGVVRDPPACDPGPGLSKASGRSLRRFAAQRLVDLRATEAITVLDEAARGANLRDRRAFTRAAAQLKARD